jgi:hypothetical protein
MTGTAISRQGATRGLAGRVLAAAMLGIVLVSTACERGPADAEPSAAPVSGLGANPDATASPAPAASGGGAGSGAGATGEAPGTSSGDAGGPSYPDSPQAYAEAVVSAWTDGDLARLGELTIAQVHEQLIQIPGPPSPDWTFIECDTGHYCSFYNGDGDFLILLIPAASIGEPHAAAKVSYNITSYPDDVVDYTREFIGAWQNGNVARMHLLAAPEAVEVFAEITPGEVTSYGAFGIAPALVGVMVTGVGFEAEVHIGTHFLGGPNAILLAIREI